MDWVRREFSGSEALQKLAKQLQFQSPSNMNIEVDNVKYLDVKEKLKNWRKRRAGVLICVFEALEGDLRVILTKRSMKLFSHPGDVALPGGKMEEGDEDDAATALREANEEIGLDPKRVQVVASLHPFITQDHLKVVPVIGLLESVKDFKPVINEDEVDAVFDVPLDMFLKEENHRCEEREWMGEKYGVHLFDFESKQGNKLVIWGLTASILIQAASLIYQTSPCFNQHPHLPDFQQLHSELITNNVPQQQEQCNIDTVNDNDIAS